MIKTLTNGRKFVLGIVATLMVAFSLVCFTPMPVTYAAEKTETSGDAAKNSNELNDVQVSMDSSGKLNVSGLQQGDSSSTWNILFNKTKVFIVGFGGLGMLVFVALFIKNFMVLGASTNNPNAHSQALKGCLWTGIAAGACGSVTLITGLFWNAFK